MTISTLIRKTIVAGNGVLTSFNFGFQLRSAADLQVYYTDAANNVTLLASNLYVVNLNPVPAGQLWANGGSVTYSPAGSAIAIGTSLTIVRTVALLQSSSLINQGGYYPNTVEQALDILTMEMQQLSETISRSLTLPVSSSATAVLPFPLANAALGWDPTGTFITNILSAGGIAIPVSIAQGGTGAANQAGALANIVVAGSITYAKIQNAVANSKLLGSGAAGAGNPLAEITLGTLLSMTGTTLNVTIPATASLDGARGLKIAPKDPVQGTLVIAGPTFAAVAAPTTFDMCTLTNGDGFLVSGSVIFNAIGAIISQVSTGTAAVWTVEYWNGAWTVPAGLTNIVSTALGPTQARWTMPGDWVTGGSGTGVPAGSFNVRVRATTAPGTQRAQGRAFLTNKFTITADEAILSTGAGVKVRHTAVNVDVDTDLAQVINGRDQAGAFGANSWAYAYLASDGVTVSGLWSASSTAPTLQGATTSKLLLGSVRVDTNSLLTPSSITGNFMDEWVSTLDLSAGSATAVTSLTITVPPEAIAVMLKVENNAAAASTICIHDKPFALTGALNFTSDCQYSGSAWAASADPIGQAFIRLTKPQTVYYAVSSSAYNLRTNCWVFPGNLN